MKRHKKGWRKTQLPATNVDSKKKAKSAVSCTPISIPLRKKNPLLYCLPKIHKKDVPFRPIVDYAGSIGYNTSQYWADTLSPLIGTSSSAAAERPCKPLNQLKSCQLLHNCTKNHIWLKDCPFLWYKNIAGRFFGLVTKHACDGRTDGQTDGRTELRLPRPR